MPVDQQPAESALSLLNGVDYSTLIGGPLKAAINAQAMAAQSTWEFIQQVGLNTDPKTGQKSAVNVTFTYIQDGNLQKLIVPILTIVPIPLIEVSEVTIDFIAKINASASSSKTESKASNASGSLGVNAKVNFGVFSASADFKASYSSKQASKGTQDSRYSVEYTQKVGVRAQQAGLPDGLSTILSILSSNCTGTSPGGDLAVSPADALLDFSVPAAPQGFEIRVIGSDGLALKNHDVDFQFQPAVNLPEGDAEPNLWQAFFLGQGVANRHVKWGAGGKATIKTDNKGSVYAQLSLAKDTQDREQLRKHNLVELGVTTAIPGDEGAPQEFVIPIRITNIPPLPPPSFHLSLSKNEVDVDKDNKPEVTLTLTDEDGKPVKQADIALDIDQPEKKDWIKINGKSPPATGTVNVKTDDNGKAKIELSIGTDAKTGQMDITPSYDGATALLAVNVKA